MNVREALVDALFLIEDNACRQVPNDAATLRQVYALVTLAVNCIAQESGLEEAQS